MNFPRSHSWFRIESGLVVLRLRWWTLRPWYHWVYIGFILLGPLLHIRDTFQITICKDSMAGSTPLLEGICNNYSPIKKWLNSLTGFLKLIFYSKLTIKKVNTGGLKHLSLDPAIPGFRFQLSLTYCVILETLINVPKLQFPYCKVGVIMVATLYGCFEDFIYASKEWCKVWN